MATGRLRDRPPCQRAGFCRQGRADSDRRKLPDRPHPGLIQDWDLKEQIVGLQAGFGVLLAIGNALVLPRLKRRDPIMTDA